jgi:hypothetical protein
VSHAAAQVVDQLGESKKNGTMNTPEQSEIITSGDSPNSRAWLALIQITTAFFNQLSLNADSSWVVNSAKKPLRKSSFVGRGVVMAGSPSKSIEPALGWSM